jgi:phosphoglycerate dehydrogenase-like enzyme
LVEGGVAGAGLDVFVEEPYVPTELRALDDVVLSPHLGGATVRALAKTRDLVLQNLDQYLTHGTLTTPVVPPMSDRRNVIHR